MARQLLLTCKQAAAAVGLGDRTIRKWIAADKLPCKQGADGRMAVPLSALKKHLDPALYETIKLNLENGLDPMALPKKTEKKPTKKPCCKACKSKKGAKRAGQH